MDLWHLCFRIILSILLIHNAISASFNEPLHTKIDGKRKLSTIKNNKIVKRQENGKAAESISQPEEAQMAPPQDILEPQILPIGMKGPIDFVDVQPCCDDSFTCEDNLYRTMDGTCNNLNNPLWGAARITYTRLLPAEYEDGFGEPRGSGRVPPLPRSRDVSVAMTETLTCSTPEAITLMVMQWGQFIDHDMVKTTNDAVSISSYMGSNCCDDFMDATQTTESCMPINVTGDKFYEAFTVKCLPFVRSTATPCDANQRQQINGVTAYLDASQVYGSSESEKIQLREPNAWRLKSGPGTECNGVCSPVSLSSSKRQLNDMLVKELKKCPSTCPLDFLPVRFRRNLIDVFPIPPRVEEISAKQQEELVSGILKEEFFAGDDRVEEQPGLTSLHTCFVRLHNDIGNFIKLKHPSSSDDEIFEKIRKFVGAIMQQITYDEFLPIVLGEAMMDIYRLKLQPKCSFKPYFYDYDPNIDASAQNVFATAAFRFGHSLVSNKYTMPNGQVVNLAESFNNHERTTIPGTYPSHFLRGISTQPSEQMDQVLVDAIQNKLLAEFPFKFGSDLYARNIERGREHGIPAYHKWFQRCGGIAKNFKDLYEVMPREVVDRLEKLYNGNFEDIDLFPAGIAENNLPGALVGPTLACLMAKHFFRLKFGDRYWFENPGIFTKDELEAIRSTKLSHLLCGCADIPEIQEMVMLSESSRNPMQNCSILRTKGIRGFLSPVTAIPKLVSLPVNEIALE